ncbi:MAG: XRE family transcriptional regulator [Actinobacteria bacterium]|nr:XRE family transcriptional regulator [Actinomycetota bacterium]
MIEDRPAWARRMTNEREARDWSQADAVRALKAHAGDGETIHADNASLLRQWKRWEAGETKPGDFYQPIIARMFGTVTHAMFPDESRRNPVGDVLALTGMDTLELVSRLQRSDLDDASLNALRVLADTLCSQYPYMPADSLLTEGRAWLRKITEASSHRLTLSQHREVLILGGWVSLLLACVEHDTGNRQAAETTRRAALSLGTEAGEGAIEGWAHEIRSWMNLTTGDYHGTIAAARAGTDAAPHQGVAVQLAAQEAKAWARIGDRRQTEVALDRGRRLLDAMPYPENLSHHFVVDPAKFDFYAMDCYRQLADDKMAENLAGEVIRTSTDFDGTERVPMRTAEAHLTRGVVAARQGDIEQAIHHGQRALNGERKSLPTLAMVSRDLARVLKERYPKEQETKSYLDQLRTVVGVHDLGHGRL